VRTSGSYVSANDPRLIFGLGANNNHDEIKITVVWGDGSKEKFGPLQTDRYHQIVFGQGRSIVATK